MYLEPKKDSGVNDIQKVILAFFNLYAKPEFTLKFLKNNFNPCLSFDSYLFPEVAENSENFSTALYRLEREFKNGYNDDLYGFVQSIRIESEK